MLGVQFFIDIVVLVNGLLFSKQAPLAFQKHIINMPDLVSETGLDRLTLQKNEAAPIKLIAQRSGRCCAPEISLERSIDQEALSSFGQHGPF
jgi:hypothetical protein